MNLNKVTPTKRHTERLYYTPTKHKLQNPVDQIEFDTFYELIPKSKDYIDLIHKIETEFEDTGYHMIEDECEKHSRFQELLKKYAHLTGKFSKPFYEKLWEETFKYIQTY